MSDPPVRFTLEAGGGDGPRAVMLHTRWGPCPTPAFMPVGTQATVKALTPDEVAATGARVILCNAYHLLLRPGPERVAAAGGLHRWMGWRDAILTDSGGFQVFSLGHLRRLEEDGVVFRSHLDGAEIRLTPESAVAVQESLGSDIAMALDVCTPHDADEPAAREALEITHRWALRCRDAHRGESQALFPVCQGGTHATLRHESARRLAETADWPGFGVGGLSVGEPREQTRAMLAASVSGLPPGRPRYLMGVGAPEDLLDAVAGGADLFDCVLPTRLGRNGGCFTPNGRISIRAARFRELDGPLDPDCDCLTCRGYAASYLHHLFRCEELLAYRLASIHNLRFLARLMEAARAAVLAGTFARFRTSFMERYRPADGEARAEQRRRFLARKIGPTS